MEAEKLSLENQIREEIQAEYQKEKNRIIRETEEAKEEAIADYKKLHRAAKEECAEASNKADRKEAEYAIRIEQLETQYNNDLSIAKAKLEADQIIQQQVNATKQDQIIANALKREAEIIADATKRAATIEAEAVKKADDVYKNYIDDVLRSVLSVEGQSSASVERIIKAMQTFFPTKTTINKTKTAAASKI